MELPSVLKSKLTRRIWIDVETGEQPYVGMFLVAVGKDGSPNSVYMVTDWRRVKRRNIEAPSRFSLTCQRGYTFDDARQTDYWRIRWYPRTKAGQSKAITR